MSVKTKDGIVGVKKNKVTRKPKDLRPFDYEYEDKEADVVESVLTRMAKRVSRDPDLIDFASLTLPINKKRAAALHYQILPVAMTTDDGLVHTVVKLESISYTRHGLTYRFSSTIDSRVNGSYNTSTYTEVDEFRNSYSNHRYVPTVGATVSRVIGKMFTLLEEKHNRALYDAKLAPSSCTRISDCE